jgi:PAS domain S-box-containing protein
VEFNKQAEELFGLEKKDLINKSPFELSPLYQNDGALSKVKALEFIHKAYSGKIDKFEWTHLKSDGTIVEVEVSLNKVTIEHKTLILVLLHDITIRKNYEEGLKAAKEKAEEMNIMKSNFLAIMSHELRTPMTGILGIAEILHDSLEDPEYKELTDIILKGGKRLTNTLNLILDLSKVEADKINIYCKPLKVSEVVNESVKLFSVYAEDKSIKLRTEITEDVTSSLDPKLLEHILSNLIKNAITYTQKGTVTVKVLREIIDDVVYAVIKVQDTGIGIPEEYIDTIFEPFRQVSEGLSRKFEGTGLGLTITKKFTEKMNGVISVESKIDVGSTFTVRFPAIESSLSGKDDDRKAASLVNEKQVIADNNVNNKPPENHLNKNLLIVEDDAINVFTIRFTLKDICKITSVETGEEAIELTKKNKYDVIIMDIGLRGISGLEALQQIRKINGYEKTPIIALTAYVMEGDRERFLAGGCSHYISKPFSPQELKKTISSLL